MKRETPRNIIASVRQRLLNVSRRQGDDFLHVLTRYVIERFLYRLSCSPYKSEFVLKGAMLFRLWNEHVHRPTRDLDLLGSGDSSVERLVNVVKDIARITVKDDGLAFTPETIRGDAIKEDQKYKGVRVQCEVLLGSARIALQIDIGFGDAITPNPDSIVFPTILDSPPPVLLAYPRQTVVAEKYEAMVTLGIANSRMKDFYDLWVLANNFAFDGPTMSQAIQATFQRRDTALPTQSPLALTSEFGTDATKIKQWNAFVKKGKMDAANATLDKICAYLNGFLTPVTSALVAKRPFDMIWHPPGPWTEENQHS